MAPASVVITITISDSGSVDVLHDDEPTVEDTDVDRRCGWCEGSIPLMMRTDAIYCRSQCRLAAHRFQRRMARLRQS